MELREVAPQVYACLQPDRGWGWSNSGFVARDGGLVVDTLMDVKHTRRMLDLYAGVSAGSPQRLVNTHHNADHCWGNQLLCDAEIYGHRFCVEALGADLPPSLLQAMIEAPELSPGARWFADDVREFDFSEVVVTPPNHPVGDEGLTLDLGGRPVEFVYVGPAHTGGDLIVHLPEDGVVFAGDILFQHCTPIGWEGTSAGWQRALEKIAALGPEVIVPGHGEPCGPESALELRDYLAFVFDESRRFYEAEVPVEDAARRIDLGPYARWTQPERLVFNVARAYREFRGGDWSETLDALPLMDEAVALRRHWDERQSTD